MQRLLDAVLRGYHWHTFGAVSGDKAQHLANKFAERYAVHRNEAQRAYAKRKGLANARLFFLAQHQWRDLHWWLCVTDGRGRVHMDEHLGDARERRSRIRIDDDYELLRRTRDRSRGGGTVWTWRMTRACYRQWREWIIEACRRPGPVEIRRAMGSLYRTPGYSGIREQVGALIVLARSEWRRRHGSLDDFVLPPRLRYVQRLPNTSVPLSEWKAGNR